MRNFYFTFVLLFIMIGSNAQVINGNFETVKPNMLPSNWGMNFSQAITLNLENGQSSGDYIQYTTAIPSMVYATTSAHTGQYAMEISNARNVTQNTVIQGSATIFADATQDSPGWNPGVPVAPTDNIQRLGFYYKFYAAGGEVAQAKMLLFDEEGYQIGSTTVDIPGTDNQFHYVYSYIYHPYNVAPAYMHITFDMAKTGYTPVFGSRLVVDNVITNPQALAVIENQFDAFTVFPTLATSDINVALSEKNQGMINYKIVDGQGKTIKQYSGNASGYVYNMNVSDLSSGLYLLEIETNAERVVRKFIKK